MKITKNRIEKETVIIKKASFFMNAYGQYRAVINGQMYETDVLGHLFTKELMANDWTDTLITCENKKQFIEDVFTVINFNNED